MFIMAKLKIGEHMRVIGPGDALLNRLRSEFLEMPGLRLKSEQVQRLCGVERTTCQMVLDSLVAEQFLWVTADGRYARRTDGHLPQPSTADLAIDKTFMVT